MKFKKALVFPIIISALGSFPGAVARSAETTLTTKMEVQRGSPTKSPESSKSEDTGMKDEDYSESSSESEPTEGAPRLKVSNSESGLKLGVNDCVQMALLNNREIKAQDYDIQSAEWKLKEAQPHGIPTIEYEFLSAPAPRNVDQAVKSFFEGDITFFQKGKIGMGIPIYTFGKIGLAQDLARTGIAAEKEKKIDKQNDIILKVQKLYYGILLANDLLDVLNDANDHLEHEVARRESENSNFNSTSKPSNKPSSSPNPASSPPPESYASEATNPVDLVRLKLYRYEVISRIEEAEKKLYLAKEGLRIQMGLEKNTPFVIAEEHLKPVEYDLKDFDTYLEMSRQYRPENRLLALGLHAKETLHRLEKRKITPNIGGGGFYEFGRTTNSISGLTLTDDFNNPFNYNRVGVGVRVNGEINIRKYQANVHEAQAEYFKTAVSKHAADEGLELDLKDSYLEVYQSNKRMANSYRAMKLARQFVFLTKTNLDIGVGDKKEYSDSLQAYLVARGRYLESIFNYNLAVATLKQKVGGVAQLK